MATRVRAGDLRERPASVAAAVTVLAYAVVIGTFLGLVPVYPEISRETSTMLSHAIAVVNAATIGCLVVGWRRIRRGRVAAHRRAMIAAVALILVFLLLYLIRVGGGGTKHFLGPDAVTGIYLFMLVVHIALSILAVPLVLYALLLGLTHSAAELRMTSHARVGRIAAAVWILSLALGLVTYAMLEHLYGAEYVATVLSPALG